MSSASTTKSAEPKPELISPRAAAAMLGISQSMLWRLSKKALGFPRPISISAGRRGYVVSEVQAWIEARKAERDTAAVPA